MAISFKFYSDAALTTEIDAGNPITAAQDVAGLLGPVDVHIYFGSTVSANKVQATSDPGNDDISVSIVDANAGTGEPATAIKLATTQGGLASATAGAALSLGTSVSGGVANAASVWVRIDDATATAGTYTDLSLETNDLTESAI